MGWSGEEGNWRYLKMLGLLLNIKSSKRLDGWIRLKLDGKVAALVAALRPAITKVWILEIAV